MCYLALPPFSALVAIAFLTGCALTNTATPSPATGLSLHGSVHGGQQAIIAAHIYLFAANTTGYGQPSVSLLNATYTGHSTPSAATSPPTPWAASPSPATTPAPPTPAGLPLRPRRQPRRWHQHSRRPARRPRQPAPAPATSSPPSPSSRSTRSTTIAAAYALAGFASDATHVSSSGTPLAQTGIANAFLNAANLASVVTRTSPLHQPRRQRRLPSAVRDQYPRQYPRRLRQLHRPNHPTRNRRQPANTLFSNATNGTTAPTDTATAAINIAHNPGANIAALYAIPAAASPFAPTLLAQPHDFTIAINYTGGGINAPTDVVFDAAGNAWVINEGGASITEITPTGSFVAGSPITGNGLLNPNFGAFDPSGNLWVMNNGGASSLSKFTSAGTAVTGSPFTGNGLKGPFHIASDATGNIWVLNLTLPAVLSKFISTGAAATGSPFTYSGLSAGDGLAIQPITGDVWMTASTSSYPYYGEIAKITPAGAQVSGSPFVLGPSASASLFSLAFDSSGNAWITSDTPPSLYELTATGAAVSGSPFLTTTQNTTANNRGPVIDGGGNIWVSDNNHNYITENSNTGAAAAGSPFSTLANPINISVDGSGDVWIPNGITNVTEFIGISVPVVTPLVTGVINNTLGTRP